MIPGGIHETEYLDHNRTTYLRDTREDHGCGNSVTLMPSANIQIALLGNGCNGWRKLKALVKLREGDVINILDGYRGCHHSACMNSKGDDVIFKRYPPASDPHHQS